MRKKYEIEIQYPNKGNTWDRYFEGANTMSQAFILMDIAQNKFPKNRFRIKEASDYDNKDN